LAETPLREPSDGIEQRTLDYAVRATRLYRVLRKGRDPAGWEIAKQYFRAATSVGANVAESQAAESDKDFAHKLAVALKEAKESAFWLQLMERSGIIPAERLSDIRQETGEIQSILATIIMKVKRRNGTAR
jgi:four helix bundle protein